ncbi:MAG: hypothetical protein AB8H80_15340, partial [Planctomycetota bacterium]
MHRQRTAQRVVLRGLRLRLHTLLADCILRLNSCAGQVVLDRVGRTPGGVLGCGLTVSQCADVRLHNCEFSGSTNGPLAVDSSHLTATESTFDALPFSFGNSFSASAVDLTDCSAQCSIFAAGFTLQNTAVRLRGNTGFQSYDQSVFDGPGIITFAPTVSFLSGTAPPFTSTVTPQPLPLPAVTAVAGAPGGTASATMVGDAQAFGWLFAGLAGPLTPIAGSGAAMLLPGNTFLLAAGPMSTPLAASYAVPSLPAALGLVVSWQGVSLDAANGLLMSNAAT